MKKLISFVMAGAMVASLVPATAFAKGEVTATAKVVDALEKAKDFNGKITGSDVPELQLKITSTDYQVSNSSGTPEMDVTVTLDNAEFGSTFDPSANIGIRLDDSSTVDNNNVAVAAAKAALDTAKAEQATAQKAYDDAVAATNITVPETSELTAAKAALATAEGAYKPGTPATGTAVTAVATAEGKVDTKQEAVDAAYAAYIANPSGSGLEAAWNTAKTELETAKTELETAKTDLETAKTTYNTAKTDLDAAQAAYDAIVADATAAAVKTELNALNVAKAKTAEKQAAYDAAVAAAGSGNGVVTFKDIKLTDKDELEFTIVGKLHKDDIVFIDLVSDMDKVSEGRKATVSVDSKMVTADDLVYASILGKGLKVSVKKTVDVAEEETVTLNSNGLKIESSVGDFAVNSKITLKLSKGFEFVKNANVTVDGSAGTLVDRTDDNELTVTVKTATDEFTLKGIEIEAASAKSGAVATITAKSSNMDSASCEVAKVVDYKVNLTVDEDEDVPVIYSGVNVANYGITDDSDHLSLEVTAEETFPGAWSMRQGFNFNLPEGVYVTDVKVTDTEDFYITKTGVSQREATKADWEAAFADAYQDGDHKNFEFAKRVFDDVNVDLRKDPATVTFQLELVADPTFEGDVKLTFEGSLVDKQEVTIAKFVKPYTVKAEQNDVIIDYRNTEIKTPIVITEAEEGLWAKDEATFKLNIEDNLLTFEDDATFTVDKDSEMDLKGKDTKAGTLSFTVKEESDAPATITITDMKLFMQRNIPAGAYALEIATSMNDAYDREVLFAPDATTVADWDLGKDRPSESTTKKDSYVDDVCDYSDVVKEAFVNVVTSGRDQDNLFTTKVVVPVGEKYLVAGENKVELDVAAYISDAGYTMLPVRAISKALGVNTNNVLWNAEARTVTIMYGQRIITMTVGQKTIYVNGSAIPSSAAPEIKDGRTFLPLRDLGTALGVTDVSWDAATKTATMNGGAK